MLETGLEMLDALNPVDSERWKALVANSPRPDAYYLLHMTRFSHRAFQ